MEEDKAKLVIRIESSADSAAGAAAAYLLRRVAARAGAYAPGIQENLFYEISQNARGSSVDKVGRWLEIQDERLAVLGYNIQARRVAAPAVELLPWVEGGRGYRAAILSVDASRLYGDVSMPTFHAVGLMWCDATAGVPDASLADGPVMIDAWPKNPTFVRPPKTLDAAGRPYKYAALIVYWSGYS